MKTKLTVLSFTLAIIVQFAPLNEASYTSQQGGCQNKAVQSSTSITWGSSVSCSGNDCPQNYTINYAYGCTLTGQTNKKCVGGSVVSQQVYTWKCIAGACSGGEPTPIMGYDFVTKECD